MTYTYYDPETNEEIEVEHGMNESPEIISEKTGNKMKRKITGGMGVIYKGEGWGGSISRDKDYLVDQEKDLIRSGEKKDPYARHRDEPL